MADIRNLINKMKVPIANQSNPYTRNGIPNVNLAETGQFVNSFMPISGDIQSGLLAAQDVKQGNYGSAALNSLGLLPFIPAMGGIIKTIKPAKESLHEVANSNFLLGIPVGNKTVDINSLKGIMSNSSSDIDKVNKLTQKMKSPEGYIERLIVDDAGNILEGQHRLNALRNLGETQVPVSVIKDMSNAVENVKKTGMRNEHAINIVQNAHDMLQEAKTPENAFQMFDIPSEYTNAYKAAFESMK